MENGCLYQIRCFQEFSIFLTKIMVPFQKLQNGDLLKKIYFYSKKRLILYEEYNQNHFKAYFEEK